jgi:uncharacterized protein (DUF362 family)
VEAVGAAIVGLKPEKMPLIQEAIKRGLGEGDIRKIEVRGIPFESLKEKAKSPTVIHHTSDQPTIQQKPVLTR